MRGAASRRGCPLTRLWKGRRGGDRGRVVECGAGGGAGRGGERESGSIGEGGQGEGRRSDIVDAGSIIEVCSGGWVVGWGCVWGDV